MSRIIVSVLVNWYCKGKVVPVQAIMLYREMELRLHWYLILVLDGDDRLAASLREGTSGILICRRLGRPCSQSCYFEEKKTLLFCGKSNNSLVFQ
jgi:hypothetical protein